MLARESAKKGSFMEGYAWSRNSVALKFAHEYFEHQRAVVIHTTSKA